MSYFDNSATDGEPMLKSRRQRDVAIGLLLLLLISLGILSISLLAIAPAKRWEQVRNWPTTPCVIVHSEFETLSSNDSDDSYGALISYEYEVNGRRYTGDQFSNEGNTHSSDQAFYRARVANYPVGSSQSCTVNPRDAKDAFIEKNEPNTRIGWFGLLVLPLSVFIWWSHLANERRLAHPAANQ